MFAKKSLGQHFLRNQDIIKKIADAAEITAGDIVLEVGPGEGTLTEFLLARAGKVVAVEKDERLIPLLQKRFASEIASGKLELVCGDILTSKLPDFSTYKLVANIPYYITGQFLRKFLQSDMQPTMMVLLLQKEVARRIVAPASPRLRRASARKESILSISIKCYGTPQYIGTVPAGAFSPSPKVDSAILKIGSISKKFFADFTEEKFFDCLKKGFAHPRKLLTSNLDISKETITPCGIAENARAENVSLAQWKCLTLVRI